MEIRRLHGRGEFIPELHWRIWCLDFHLVFRLAIFFHMEAHGSRNLVGNFKHCAPTTEHCVLGNDHFTLHRAERVSLEVFNFHHLLASAIGQDESARLIRPPRFIRLEIADITEVKLQVRRVSRFVERAVRDAVAEIAVGVFKLGNLDVIRLKSKKYG